MTYISFVQINAKYGILKLYVNGQMISKPHTMPAGTQIMKF